MVSKVPHSIMEREDSSLVPRTFPSGDTTTPSASLPELDRLRVPIPGLYPHMSRVWPCVPQFGQQPWQVAMTARTSASLSLVRPSSAICRRHSWTQRTTGSVPIGSPSLWFGGDGGIDLEPISMSGRSAQGGPWPWSSLAACSSELDRDRSRNAAVFCIRCSAEAVRRDGGNGGRELDRDNPARPLRTSPSGTQVAP